MPTRILARLLHPRFSTLAGLTLAAFAGVVGALAAYVDAQDRVQRAQVERLDSFRLARELRQSSDDLTRMVRVYVATGDLQFKRYYQEILDIRDGRAPRPLDYQNVYWDLVLQDGRRPGPSGSAVPLLEMMRRAGFTSEEFAQLARSKAESDALTETEFAAMALVEADPSPASRLKAIGLLHDARYLRAKAAIMAPLGEFDRMADARTLRSVRSAQSRALATLVALVVFGVLLGVMLWRTRRQLRLVLGGPAEDVLAGISRLGRGDFSTPVPAAAHEDSVLAWLAKTREDLERIDAERQRAAETLRESERRFHQALDVMMEGCMLIDVDWTYLYVNEVAAQHGRRPREALVGRRMTEVYPGIRTTPIFASFLHVMERRQPRRVEESFTFDDGSVRWFEFSIVPIAEGIFVLSLDVTERRELAQRLSAANADLERQVTERTADLQAALDAARQASQAKTAFLSHMSHELRTPMNAILGFSQLLLLDALRPDERARVAMIEQAGRHLLALIDELLDLTRIEQGRTDLALAPVALAPVVEEALALVRPLVAQRRLQVAVDIAGDLTVRADAVRLRQVVVNLLSNSAKYNRDGGRVTVRAKVDGEEVVLSVADTGVGIRAEDLPRLFRPFERLEPTRHRVDGTGIGLALSRHLVTLMGGRIEATSVPGEGSVFRVTLPRAAPVVEAPSPGLAVTAAPTAASALSAITAITADPPVAPVPSPAPAGARTFDVLYVEDHPANAEVVAALFAMRPGWRLRVAPDGPTGLALARERAPDAVLLDIHLPGMDGFAVLAALRAEPGLRDVPVLALSADAMPGQAERGRAAGFLDYLTKPLDLPQLLERLDALAEAAADRADRSSVSPFGGLVAPAHRP